MQAPSLSKMEMEKAVIRNALFKCRTRDIMTLIQKWGYFNNEHLKRLNFRASKNILAEQIWQVCEDLGLKHEIGELDLLCMQLHSSSRNWTVLKLKGNRKDYVDPQELKNHLANALAAECIGNVYLNVKCYGGATWMRLLVHETGPFRAANVVYLLSYPHTPILITTKMQAKMQNILFSALLEVFDTEEIHELQLSGRHLPSLADLALQQSAQGSFQKYRDLEERENPLVRSRTAKEPATVKEIDKRLRDENSHEKQERQQILDRTFGTHAQPTLEKLQYTLDLRFRGTTFAPKMKGKSDLFHCRVKFEGTSVLEGTKNLGKTGLAIVPLPKHLAQVNTLAKNHLVIAEIGSAGKKTSTRSQK